MNFRENPFVIRIIQILSVLLILVIVSGVYLILVFFPTPTTAFNRALLYYKKNFHEESLEELRSLPEKKQTQEIKLMMGWNYLRIKNYAMARAIFQKVFDDDPYSEEAIVGLAQVALSTHEPELALDYLKKLKNPSKSSNQLVLADTYYRLGRNVEAAQIYRTLIEKNREKEEATQKYLSITGFAKYEKGQPLTLPARTRPSEHFIKFRAPQRDYIEIKTENGWEPIYIKGANLSGALPGSFVTETPQEVQPYLEWFDLMAKMHCNTFRIYNRHYPAFYQALKMYNDSAKEKIWFIQEIWLEERDPENEEKMNVYDIYDPSWTEGFYKELRNAVDVVHGNADIPFERGRSAGIYSADVSEYLLAYGIGRELEPYIAVETNKQNPKETHYDGSYVSLPHGTPTEKWFAEKFDWIAKYEFETYNAEHPLTLVSWGPLDALYHPSEPNREDEVKWQRFYGIPVGDFTKKQLAKGAFEANVVSNDMTRYRATSRFEGGLFVAFNIYPHWPQFMYTDYQGTYDEWGHNPFFGYLLDLKAHYQNMPLLIGEYGISTSWIPIIEPKGSFNYGGYSEKEQAELLERLTYNVQLSKCAGGLVFEFQDGWWKRDTSLSSFEIFERKPYWYNALDPQEGYGLQGYHALAPFPLLRGKEKDWSEAQLLSKQGHFSFSKLSGDLKKVYAFSDETFLYIRVDVGPWNKPENLKWDEREYWIGLSTLPGIFGTKLIDDKDFYVDDGINFLIKLNGQQTSQILIAQNYNPVYWKYVDLRSRREKHVSFKKHMPVKVDLISPFEKIEFPGELLHFLKDGQIVNPLPTNRSPLHYGMADLSTYQYGSYAAWHINIEKGMIEIRIPWGLLYMMDPSSRLAFGGLTKGYETIAEMKGAPQETPGIGIVVLDIQHQKIINSLPACKDKIIAAGQLPIYRWQSWTKPKVKPYLKESYYKIQETFKNLNIPKQ